jgi:hypothetical protein
MANMVIPDIDKQFSVIRQMDIQYSNGYAITTGDYVALANASTHIEFLKNMVKHRLRKEGKL